MSYTPYADVDYYKNTYQGTVLTDGDDSAITKALTQASRNIDTLTFGRIQAQGFDSLTTFQQEIIKEVVCEQAEFETTNADVINMVLSNYSINGVSMGFGDSWNVQTQNGVAIKRNVYEFLGRTGLTWRGATGR